MHPDSTTGSRSRRSARKHCQAIESLEPRRFLSVTQNAAGWSVFSYPSASDGRKVYVSKDTDGNDANSGLDPAHPVRSLSVAKGLMRDGKADWLLFKRVANKETW